MHDGKHLKSLREVVLERLPDIDETIRDYIEAILGDISSWEEMQDIVGSLLVGTGLTEEASRAVCECLRDYSGMMTGETLSKQQKQHIVSVTSHGDLKRLESPVILRDLSERFGQQLTMANGWMYSQDDKTTVDTKKLELAEKRLVKKQDRRLKQQQQQDTTLSPNNDDDDAISVNAIGLGGSSGGGRSLSRSQDIRIDNFDITCYGKLLLAEASVLLMHGRRYGLVGRNGIGKSTFMKNLASRALPVPSHLHMVYVEQEVAADDSVTALESVLSADPDRTRLQEEERTWQRVISDASKSNEPSAAARRDEASRHLNRIFSDMQELDIDKGVAKAAKILSGLGFTNEKHGWPTKAFSGGWRMRLALARALFIQPDVLLLDEPTNMLDVKAVVWLETYLQNWSKTVLVVSHDRDFLNAISTDILHMVNYKLEHYRGDYDTFCQARNDRLLNQQREFDSQELYRKHLQRFVDRWRCSASRASQAQSKLKIIEKLPELQPVEDDGGVVFRLPQPEPLMPPMVQLHDVAFGYDVTPSSFVLHHVELGLDADSRVALIGANGAGKSTLLKLIVGDVQPTGGYIQRQARLRFGYFTQHHMDQLEGDLSPLEFLQKHYPGLTVEDYRRRLGAFGISGELALRPIRVLSGGQKSRVAFTVMCWHHPHVLVLDEPTNHLDIESIQGLIEALKNFQGSVLVVSHDEHLITSVCREIWLCEAGRVVKFHGDFKDYRKQLLEQQAVDRETTSSGAD